MQHLLVLSRGIDTVTAAIGRRVSWLVLAAVLVSAGNAVIRKVLGTSSNVWLELQWWLYGLVFLLASPWTLARNEHIRIDILSSRFPRAVRGAIELGGHVFFLLPVCAILTVLSWPFFLSSAPSAAELRAHAAAFDPAHMGSWLGGFFRLGEQSPNAGGLPQWLGKGLIPLAFALLFVQGVSELIKRTAIVLGVLPEPGAGGGYHAAAIEMPERPEEN